MLKVRHFLAAGSAAAFFGSLQLGAVYGALWSLAPVGLPTSAMGPSLSAGAPIAGMMMLGFLGTFFAMVPCVVLGLLFGPLVRSQYASVGVGRPTGYVVVLIVTLVGYGVAGAVLGGVSIFVGMFAAGMLVYPVTGLLALNLMAKDKYPPFRGIPADPY